MAVFVTAPAGLRQARALARDGPELLPYLEAWWRREEVHFAADATREHAELVVNGASAEVSDPTGSYIRLR